MNTRLLSTLLLAAFGFAALTSAQEKKDQPPAKPPAAKPPEKTPPAKVGAQAGEPDMQAQMEKMLQLSQPNENHKRLEPFAGQWTTSFKCLSDPSAATEAFPGTAEMDWVLGGRFMHMHFTGQAMGMPFEGFGVMGYDNVRKEYVMGWVDSMNTAVTKFTGTVDPSGKTFTWTGRCDDPMTGQRDKLIRSVITIQGKDKILEEVYEAGPDNKERKTGEITYTRKL